MMFIRFLKKIKRFAFGMINSCIYKFKYYKHRSESRKYRKLPLERKIVFSNFNGLGYGCNPKYIAEEILKRNMGWDLVWLVNDPEADLPSGIRKIKFNSKESCRELSTAKIIINNVKGELNFKKRKGQIYIQTWHAGFSIKKLEREAQSTLPKEYILESKDNSAMTDYILSNSEMQTEEYKNNFWYKGKILEFGLPRNDPYFTKNNARFVHEMKEKLNISEDEFVIIYAPTFRSGNDTFSTYGLDFEHTLNAFTQRLSRKCKLLIRTHPNVACKNNIVFSDERILDVSSYPDMQELLICSDLLITDYSSTMFEFSMLGRPTILFANDAALYDKKIRGLKDIFWNGLFPLAETNEKLNSIIENFEYDKAVENTLFIRSKYCTYDKGDASEKVVDYLTELMDNGME